MRVGTFPLLVAGAAMWLSIGMAGCSPEAATTPPNPAHPPAPAEPGGAVPTPDTSPSVATSGVFPEDIAPVFFSFDSSVLSEAARAALDQNAKLLRSRPDFRVTVEGHCDERGSSEYNLALGERRAKSTMNYLVSQGVQASRITIISYGEERPVCTQKNEECWSKNRRAQYLVKPR